MRHNDFDDDGQCAGSEVSSLKSGTARPNGQCDHASDPSVLPFVPPFEIVIPTIEQEHPVPRQIETNVVEWLALPAICEFRAGNSNKVNTTRKEIFLGIPATRRIETGAMLVDDGQDVVGPKSLPKTIRRRTRKISTDSPSILMKNDAILEVPSTPSTYHTGHTCWASDDDSIDDNNKLQGGDYDNIRRWLVFEEETKVPQRASKWTKKNIGRFSWRYRNHRHKNVELTQGCII